MTSKSGAWGGLSKADLAQQLHTDIRNPYVGILYRLMGMHKWPQPEKWPQFESSVECADALLRTLKVKVDQAEATSIPAEGPLIVVANHPFGAVDGLILINQIGRHRPDLKLLTDLETPGFSGLSSAMLPMGQKPTTAEIKRAVDHLEAGGVLVVFPAGEVSRFSRDLRTVADGRWSTFPAWLQETTGAPILPVFIDGHGVDMVRLFEAVHPGLRRLPLPHRPLHIRRPLRNRQRGIQIRIGRALARKEMEGLENLEQVTRFLRAKTHALGAAVQVKRNWFAAVRKRAQRIEPLAAPISAAVIEAELLALPEEAKPFEQSGFACYVAAYAQIPETMQAIGRLREETFRAVGEGTNHALDLDEFDLYYHHLILWDTRGKAIAGAYRMGMGPVISEEWGTKGFYTSTLFRFDKRFKPILKSSIELGRSFVPVAYQRHRMPLFLLWKGILVQLIRNPDCRYIIGPVTISNSYNPLSRLLMMNYVSSEGRSDEFEGLVKPRKPYKPKLTAKKLQDPEALLAAVGSDIRKLDKVVADIEPEGFALPVLLKRYLAQNARILAFNHDPKFNDALDGFMILDLEDLPQETVANLQHEFA
jgi:putative hemolysin